MGKKGRARFLRRQRAADGKPERSRGMGHEVAAAQPRLPFHAPVQDPKRKSNPVMDRASSTLLVMHSTRRLTNSELVWPTSFQSTAPRLQSTVQRL